MKIIKTKIREMWGLTGLILLLVGVTWGLTQLAKKNHDKVEAVYASKIYPYIAKAMGMIVGKVPCSVGELMVFGVLLGLVIGIVFLILKPSYYCLVFHRIIQIIGIGYVVFYFSWGFNYYRKDYMDLAGMSQEVASTQDLRDLTKEIIIKANKLREEVGEDDEGVFKIHEEFAELAEMAREGFENYQLDDVNLPSVYGPAKPLLISKAMSYTGITGIYFPFTGEANINIDVPDVSIPSTICHEMGHQIGFAKEEEANFIAYQACINNSHPQFQYSGYYLALQYLMNDLYKVDLNLYTDLSTQISDEVKRDMNHAYNYWKMREGKAEKVATTMNDNYLKANNQTQGVKSYNGVVKLLLADYKTYKLSSGEELK